MKEILSYAAGLFAIAGFIPYIRAILRRTSKPSKASWIVWISLDSIVLLGMFLKGALNGQIIGAVAGGVVVIALSIKYGTPGWTKLDKYCMAGGLGGIILWMVLGNPLFAIMASLSVILVGSIPTFTSAWADPRNEDPTAWILFSCSSVPALLGIPTWDIEHAAQPIIFATINATMLFLLFVRPRIWISTAKEA